jgi:signal transduction histidine kinase
MIPGNQWRLIAVGFALGLTALLIAFFTLDSQNKAVEARARLGQVDLESFQIADLFKYKVRAANDKMRQYGNRPSPQLWEEFLKASEELKQWIAQETPRLRTRSEKQTLKQMDSTYEVYQLKAHELHSLVEASGESGASLAEYSGFFQEARHFLDLGQELARAHYESRNEVLDHVNRTLTQLSYSVLGLVGLLFVFGVGLAASVYRDLIAPLRIKLVETQATAERNEKLASLGMLAAGVAHEIRNPLTAIKTALFIQQKKAQPGSPEQRDSELIAREILRLEQIVNDFLEFARPAAPRLAVVPAEVPLQEVEALLSPQLAETGLRLVREASGPLRINVDLAQIKQVLINLVQNAADSSERGGIITLRARPARQRLSDGETDVVILEVADTGKGISAEVEKRLFDPFFTTKDKGTGLGLPIAARIVELHGGTLQYQTQVNRGSTFGIVLPQAKG